MTRDEISLSHPALILLLPLSSCTHSSSPSLILDSFSFPVLVLVLVLVLVSKSNQHPGKDTSQDNQRGGHLGELQQQEGANGE